MADYAPNFTLRYRFRYSVRGLVHKMLWRGKADGNAGDLPALITKVGLFLDAIGPALWDDFTVLSAEYSLPDADIFLPADGPSFDGGAIAVAGSKTADRIVQTSWVGRSAIGHRAVMYMYGVSFQPGVDTGTLSGDFRVLAAESAQVGESIEVLNDGAPDIYANDGVAVTWSSYVNTKYNDHWLRKARAGG
jgi:hypothetical protein